MNDIDNFIHNLFSCFEETEELKELKKKTHKELCEKYDVLISQGLTHDEAILQIKIDFGAREFVLHQLNEKKAISHYEKFKSLYPKLKNFGLIAIGAVTLLAITVAGTTSLKLEMLTTWIVLIILLVFFEMTVEYLDYWFTNRYSFMKPDAEKRQLEKPKTHKEKKESQPKPRNTQKKKRSNKPRKQSKRVKK